MIADRDQERMEKVRKTKKTGKIIGVIARIGTALACGAGRNSASNQTKILCTVAGAAVVYTASLITVAIAKTLLAGQFPCRQARAVAEFRDRRFDPLANLIVDVGLRFRTPDTVFIETIAYVATSEMVGNSDSTGASREPRRTPELGHAPCSRPVFKQAGLETIHPPAP